MALFCAVEQVGASTEGDVITREYACVVTGTDLPPEQNGHDSWHIYVPVVAGDTIADVEAKIVAGVQYECGLRNYALPNECISFSKATRGV